MCKTGRTVTDSEPISSIFRSCASSARESLGENHFWPQRRAANFRRSLPQSLPLQCDLPVALSTPQPMVSRKQNFNLAMPWRQDLQGPPAVRLSCAYPFISSHYKMAPTNVAQTFCRASFVLPGLILLRKAGNPQYQKDHAVG
jgi:hypothetical protein